MTHDDTQHLNLRETRTVFLDYIFAPTFIHIKGMDNTAADGLSGLLPMADDDNNPPVIAGNIFAILQNNLDREAGK